MDDRWQIQVMADRLDYERLRGFYDRWMDGQKDRQTESYICDCRVAFATEKQRFFCFLIE